MNNASNGDSETPPNVLPLPKLTQIHTSESVGDMTRLLSRWSGGSREAENQLFALLLPSLKRMASHIVNGERNFHAPEPSELVNEVYFRMTAARDRAWQGRGHFIAAAALAMRRHLIDCARKRRRTEFVEFDEHANPGRFDAMEWDLAITVNRLLEDLAEIRPSWCKLVKLRYFTGLTEKEAAATMGISLRTTQRMWSLTRQWLFTRIAADAPRRGRPE